VLKLISRTAFSFNQGLEEYYPFDRLLSGVTPKQIAEHLRPTETEFEVQLGLLGFHCRLNLYPLEVEVIIVEAEDVFGINLLLRV